VLYFLFFVCLLGGSFCLVDVAGTIRVERFDPNGFLYYLHVLSRLSLHWFLFLFTTLTYIFFSLYSMYLSTLLNNRNGNTDTLLGHLA